MTNTDYRRSTTPPPAPTAPPSEAEKYAIGVYEEAIRKLGAEAASRIYVGIKMGELR